MCMFGKTYLIRVREMALNDQNDAENAGKYVIVKRGGSGNFSPKNLTLSNTLHQVSVDTAAE